MMLKVDGLSFSYKSRQALRDVVFGLEPGSLAAILGPNGVGKTTLLKCVNAILRPTGGAVWLDGQCVADLSPGEAARRMGYVAQRAEPVRQTVYDAVLMGRKPHIRWRVSDRDLAMVDAVLGRLDLRRLALRRTDELSGGELQKVAVARALLQEPRLLLLDEPTSSLDMKNQCGVMDMVRRVVDEHRVAALMTMHDLNTALSYADHCVFLKDGAIHACCRPDQVTAATVEAVYGLAVEVHDCGGRPVILPLGRSNGGPKPTGHTREHSPKEAPCPVSCPTT